MQMQVNMPKELEESFKDQLKEIAIETIRDFGVSQQLPEFMDLGQTAAYLNVSRGTLTKFIKSGLKITIVGQTKRIKRTDADHFMEQNKI